LKNFEIAIQVPKRSLKMIYFLHKEVTYIDLIEFGLYERKFKKAESSTTQGLITFQNMHKPLVISDK